MKECRIVFNIPLFLRKTFLLKPIRDSIQKDFASFVRELARLDEERGGSEERSKLYAVYSVEHQKIQQSYSPSPRVLPEANLQGGYAIRHALMS